MKDNKIKIDFSKFIKAHNGSRRYCDMDKKMVELFQHPARDEFSYYTLIGLVNPKTGRRRRNIYLIRYNENKIWLEMDSWSKTVTEQELREAFDELKEFFIKLSYADYTNIKIRKQKKEGKEK